MKAPAFDYQAPESVEEALALIGETQDGLWQLISEATSPARGAEARVND